MDVITYPYWDYTLPSKIKEYLEITMETLVFDILIGCYSLGAKHK